MGKVIALVGLLALAGCTATGGSYCSIAKPIRPTAEDVNVISDQLVQDVLTHNKQGAALCGWKQGG